MTQNTFYIIASISLIVIAASNLVFLGILAGIAIAFKRLLNKASLEYDYLVYRIHKLKSIFSGILSFFK